MTVLFIEHAEYLVAESTVANNLTLNNISQVD